VLRTGRKLYWVSSSFGSIVELQLINTAAQVQHRSVKKYFARLSGDVLLNARPYCLLCVCIKAVTVGAGVTIEPECTPARVRDFCRSKTRCRDFKEKPEQE